MNATISGAIRCYHWFISPLIHQAAIVPGGCRFSPTCSDYALAAVRQYGLAFAFVLIMKRLLRCHPWSAGGYDPVPSAHTRCPHANSMHKDSHPIRETFRIAENKR